MELDVSVIHEFVVEFDAVVSHELLDFFCIALPTISHQSMMGGRQTFAFFQRAKSEPCGLRVLGAPFPPGSGQRRLWIVAFANEEPNSQGRFFPK